MTEAEFLSQYMLPDEERKRLLLGNVLLGIGGGLMSGKRGNEIGALGSGAVVGAQMGQQAISDAQRGQIDKLKLRQTWQAGEDKKREQEAGAAFEQQLSAPGDPGMEQWQLAMRNHALASAKGDVKRAEEYRKAAEFYRVKYGLTPQTLMRDGKPVVAQMSEYGDVKEMAGYSPKPDYQKVDTGKQTMFYDPVTGAQGGQFAMQTTPGQDQSAALQRAQMAQSERRFNANQTNAQAPAWVNDLERGIQIDPRSGQSRPITANGAPVGAKGITKQSDQSKTALTIITEAEKLIDKSTGSYLGAGVDQAARVFGGSTEGAEASAQLQALEGALMLNQPRMEGPQSDKDTMIYKQMAGKIGDPTVPNPIKKAALATIKVLHKKYSTGASVGGATGGWSIEPAN